jgi:DNA damage-binding protein 1
MRHSKAIFGTVSMLAKIRPIGAKTDHLLIGTIRFQYFTVLWDPETQQLETSQQFADGSEKHMRESQSRDLCMVDPTGQYLVLELFEGILTLIKILKPRKGRGDYLDKPEQVRITELRVRASTFLYTETKQPKIAFLYDCRHIG